MSGNSKYGTYKGGDSRSRAAIKQSTRGRLLAERAREARRGRMRRRLAAGGSAVAVLALAAGIGIAVSGTGGGTNGGTDGGDKVAEAAADGPLKIPANTSGQGGTVLTYGSPDAKHTLKVYEDPRCPYCAQFEQADGETVRKLADEGRFKVEYHFATFLDDALGGHGSKRALAALGAAVNEGPDKFLDYHRVLFANHPDEQDDAYASTSHLLDLAGQVDGLRGPAFDKAVKDLTYLPWAKKVSADFDRSGVTGTPTVLLNDKKLDVLTGQGAVSPRQFTALVDKELGAQ